MTVRNALRAYVKIRSLGLILPAVFLIAFPTSPALGQTAVPSTAPETEASDAQAPTDLLSVPTVTAPAGVTSQWPPLRQQDASPSQDAQIVPAAAGTPPPATPGASEAEGQDSISDAGNAVPASPAASDAAAQPPTAVADPAQRLVDASTGSASPITIRAGKHPTFDRLVFDWERPVNYTIDETGGRVTIRFDAPGQADFTSVRFMRLPYGPSFQDVGGADGLAIAFAAPEGAEISDFRLGEKVVVDIAWDKSNPSLAEVPAAPAAPAQRRTQPEPAAPVAPALTPPTQTATAEPAPSPPPPRPPVIAARPAPPETPSVAAAPEPPAIPSTPPGTLTDASAAAETVTTTTGTTGLARIADVQSDAAGSTPEAAAAADTGIVAARIRLDPNAPTAAAVFTRGGHLWLGLALPNLSVEPLIDGPLAEQLRNPGIFPLENGTAYRFNLPPGLLPRVRSDDRVWEITLSPAALPASSASIEIEGTDAGAGKRLSVGVSGAATVLEIVDPDVGDLLMAVPVVREGDAVREARRLPQLEFLPASQGVVLRPLVGDLEVNAGADAVKITAPGGLLLSADRQALLAAEPDTPEVASISRIFDLETWQRGPLEEFEPNLRRLESEVAARPAGNRSIGRLDIGRLYFSHGYGAETLGMLRVVARENPAFADAPEFIALRGAALALIGDGPQALGDLTNPALGDHPEAQLWRGVAFTRQGAWRRAAEAFRASGDMVLSYPDGLFKRVSVLMAEALLVADEIDAAIVILDELERRAEEIEINQAALDYLRGEVDIRRGDVEQGRTVWQAVAGQAEDQLYRVKAEFGLVEEGLASGSMAPEEAIDRLEQLRFAWRGDTLELAILRRLGRLYLDEDEYFAGLTLLRRAAGYFPGSTQADVLTRDMTSQFRQLFLEGEADALSPVEAFGLYDEFRELTPTGSDGDQVIQRLAERLISVDLLAEAGDILQDQVEFRLSGEEKVRVGTRLAGVRLLDDEPELALEALELSAEGGIPVEQRRERLLLRARAHQQMGEPDEALVLLAGDNSPATHRLRADIGWRSGNWRAAADGLAQIVGDPPPPGEVPTDEQVSLVMNLATALTLGGFDGGIEELRERFGPAMALSDRNESFQLITRPSADILLADRGTLSDQMAEVDLFGDFLSAYRSTEWSDAASTIAGEG